MNVMSELKKYKTPENQRENQRNYYNRQKMNNILNEKFEYVKDYMRKRYNEDPEYREKKKEQNKKQIEKKKSEDPEYQAKIKLYNKERRQRIKEAERLKSQLLENNISIP